MAAIMVLSCFAADAQDYNMSAGIRAGGGVGFTGKFIGSENKGIEGLINFIHGGVNVTALYEIHTQAFEVEGLQWYYGFGAHIGFWDDPSETPWSGDTSNDGLAIGVDGIFGIEYQIQDVPFTVSLDYKPALNIISSINFWGSDFGLSVRYVIQ